MIFVFRFLQSIIILFMLVTTGLVVDSWLKTSSVKWGILFGFLGVFAGMAAILELLIKNRKNREKQKKEYPGETVQKRWTFMNSVYRGLQIIVILFMLLIVIIQIFHHNSNSSFEWPPFLATLAIFGGMAAILEALIQSRKRRNAHKGKYNEAYIKTLEHLEFRFSKLKGLILFILMLALILAVMYLGAIDNSPLIRDIVEKLKLGEDRWLAFWGLEFGCLALLIQGTRKMHFLYVVNGDKPYLSINESGLFSPNVGELSWRDILGFELITRSVRSSRIYHLRVLLGSAGGKSQHKDIQLNGIQELEPEHIFAIARWLHEKYTGGRNVVSAEFQEQLDEVEIEMQLGAALLEQATSGSIDYFQGMRSLEQGLLQMQILGQGSALPPQKRVWDRNLKACMEKEDRLNRKLEDVRRKWIAHLLFLETQLVEGQAVDMETFERNNEKATAYINGIMKQLSRTRELTNRRTQKLFRYRRIAIYVFGILFFIGTLYLQIR